MNISVLPAIKPNHQYSFYIYGSQKAFGMTGNDFMVNALETKARPLTARGGPPRFARQITTRTDEDLLEFKDVVLESVKNYLRWEETGKWPLGDVNACAMYGGCGFLDVCSSPSVLRKNVLEAKFEHR